MLRTFLSLPLYIMLPIAAYAVSVVMLLIYGYIGTTWKSPLVVIAQFDMFAFFVLFVRSVLGNEDPELRLYFAIGAISLAAFAGVFLRIASTM